MPPFLHIVRDMTAHGAPVQLLHDRLRCDLILTHADRARENLNARARKERGRVEPGSLETEAP
eukprot:2366798-Pyramimonas_sp.AAC.1